MKLVDLLTKINGREMVEIYQNGHRVFVGLVISAVLFADNADVADDWDFSDYPMRISIK